MKWKPSPRTGLLVGSAIMALILLVDAALLWRVIHGPLDGVSFVSALLVLASLAALALIGYRIYDLLHLRYEFDRNRLMIVTGATTHVIPMNRVVRVIDRRQGRLRARVGGVTWPGCSMGQGEIEGIGLTLFYAVSPPEEQAIIVTPTLAYGISLPDTESFMDVFEACQELGPITEVRQESRQSGYVQRAIWSDRVAQGVLLGNLVLCALLFGLLCFRYPGLPALLPLHYDALGQPDRIAPRSEVFSLPIIGLITWAVNGLLGAVFYRHERLISYLAWSGALVVQLFFLLALWRIVV